jgi:catalase (peroxidase I)
MGNMNNQERKMSVFRRGRPVAKQSAGSAANNRVVVNQLRLNVLRQHSSLSNPMEETLIMLKHSK